MIITRDYIKNDYRTPDLWCDKYFPFEETEEKCLRTLVGNCLYDIIESNYDNGELKEDTPQHIKDLINGTSYQSNGCGCTCSSSCTTSVWAGLKDLVKMCIQQKWIQHYLCYNIGVVDKELGTRKYHLRSFDNLKRTIYNEMAVMNNISTCGCVSLHQFIKDHEENFEQFKGLRLKLVSII